jgi:hypothetical protein
MTESDVDTTLAAQDDAEEAIQFAILHALSGDERNGCLALLGIEMALLRHAARIAIIQEKTCHAQNTVDIFLDLARSMYEEVIDMRAPELSKGRH